MTKSKESIAAAQELVKSVLAKHFNQKVDAKSAHAAAVKLVDTVPNVRPAKKVAA